MKEIKNIVLATDFSAASETAREHAEAMAKVFNARLGILHVLDQQLLLEPIPYYPVGADYAVEYLEQGRAGAQNALEKLCESINVECDAHLIEGNPAKEIVLFVKENDVDLLIMGTHGYSGLSRWFMGSVAEYVVRYAHCPVLAIKQERSEKGES